MADVLLDTTFILPTLGISVKEVSNRDFIGLRQLSKKVSLHCSYVSFVEVFGKLAKGRRTVGKSMVNLGIKSLLESGTYRWLNPSSEALQMAYELRTLGHKDNIDNILYSMALDSEMLFLSLDKELRDFLRKHGYNTDIIVDTRELQARA